MTVRLIKLKGFFKLGDWTLRAGEHKSEPEGERQGAAWLLIDVAMFVEEGESLGKGVLLKRRLNEGCAYNENNGEK